MQLTASLLLLLAQAAPPHALAELDSLLDRTARATEKFAAEFPAVACNESVTQAKFVEGPKIVARQESQFDYLILLNTEGGDFSVEESRLNRGKDRKDPQQPLLATTGFAVMLLVFHPHFQPSYHFSRLGAETRDGVAWEKIQFEHESGKPSPSVLEVRGRQYPLAWRGVAWIHPETGVVSRIQTELRDPLEDIGLLSLKSDVTYAKASGAIPVWLPRTAVIEAHTRHQHWRNTHEFSAYRRFEVSSEQKVQGVKAQ